MTAQLQRFKEYVADRMAASPLLEMAIERKRLVQKAQDYQSEIATHVIKIVLFPKDQARHHWESELNAWFESIQDMVYDRKKRLTQQQYFKIFWEELFEHTDIYDVRLRKFAKAGYSAPKEVSSGQQQQVRDILWTVSGLIAQGRFIGMDSLS